MTLRSTASRGAALGLVFAMILSARAEDTATRKLASQAMLDGLAARVSEAAKKGDVPPLEVLWNVYADEVKVDHTPPRDGDDTPWNRATLVDASRRDQIALHRAVPDLKVEFANVRGRDGKLTVKRVYSGTLSDGTKLNVHSTTVWVIDAHGQVVRFMSLGDPDPAATAIFRRALKEGMAGMPKE